MFLNKIEGNSFYGDDPTKLISFTAFSHQPNEQRENTREKPCGNDIRSRDRDTPLNRLDRLKGSCPEGDSVVETFINRLDLRKGVPL